MRRLIVVINKTPSLSKFLICFSAFAFATICTAQTLEFAGRRIRSIEYAPSNVLHPKDLDRLRLLKPGDLYRADDIAEQIDRLFATGLFEDIAAEVDPSGDGVTVRFVTQPARFVGGLTITGGIPQPPNRGEVTSNAQLQLGARFHQEDVTGAVERISGLLQSNGLYEANVSPQVNPVGTGEQVFVTFRVKSGKRAKYESPVFQGETGLSDGSILRATGWRVPLIHWWRHVTEVRTRTGVQKILGKYQKDKRLTTKVELQSLDYDAKRRRVRPTVSIKPGPKIRIKAVEAKVSQRVLKRYVPVFQERTVDNDLLVEGARNLRDYFQSRGYYDVDVTFRTQPVLNDEQTIEYVISLGTRFKLVKLAIAGNKYFREEDLRERMFMTPAAFFFGRGRYSEAFRKKDEENLGNLYRSNGFREVKITSVIEHSVKEETNGISVTVRIEEGPQWLVDSVNLEGVSDNARRQMFAERFASAEGQPFSEVNMATDRAAVLTWYFLNGYPRADLKTSWEAVGSASRVRVTYTVTEGERHFVRDIVTTGLRTTSRKLVAQRITLHPGDPLSSTVQQDIQRTFYDMGVFARVDTAIENPGGNTNYKNVLYNFEEANRYTLALGFGAQVARFGRPSSSSVSAPGGSTGFSPQVSLNLSRLKDRKSVV